MELGVGRIVKSHGIRGEVVVELRTDSPEERFAPGSVLTVRSPRRSKAPTEGPDTLTVQAARNHSGRLLVRFEGIADRDAADALRGIDLVVDSAELAPLEAEDEFYDHDLVDLAVLYDGAEIGRVAEVLHTSAGELLAIATPADGPLSGREVLVPFIEQFVPEIDVPGGTLVIAPPEGLLDLGSPESS